MIHRAQHAHGLAARAQIEMAVHRGNDEIELGEQRIGQRQRAVRENVDLDALQEPDALELGVQPVDRLHLLSQPPLVEPMDDPEVLRVIGNGEVFESRRARRQRHGPASPSWPSVASVCACRSPRRSSRVTSAGQFALRSRASISPRSSRSSAGIQGRPTAANTDSSVSPAIRRRPRKTPYSLILSLRSWASRRTRMTCALLPVK